MRTHPDAARAEGVVRRNDYTIRYGGPLDTPEMWEGEVTGDVVKKPGPFTDRRVVVNGLDLRADTYLARPLSPVRESEGERHETNAELYDGAKPAGESRFHLSTDVTASHRQLTEREFEARMTHLKVYPKYRRGGLGTVLFDYYKAAAAFAGGAMTGRVGGGQGSQDFLVNEGIPRPDTRLVETGTTREVEAGSSGGVSALWITEVDTMISRDPGMDYVVYDEQGRVI